MVTYNNVLQACKDDVSEMEKYLRQMISGSKEKDDNGKMDLLHDPITPNSFTYNAVFVAYRNGLRRTS